MQASVRLCSNSDHHYNNCCICHYSAHPSGPLHQGKLHQHQSNSFNVSINSPSSDIVRAGQKISNHKYGFVMALTYSGQQGAGIQALMSLQCFVGSFSLPMEIVEPVISSTRFESFSSSTNNRSLVTFSDMFDRKHFNDISVDAGLGQSKYIISFSSTPFLFSMRAGGHYSLFIMQF